ncbi:MAG: phage tail protein [Burkholderiales bacterium]|nr:phage tail protein [Burkholderiales bacterium]
MNPFVGEIRACAFNFAPRGWALCSGQLMSIAQNQVLFALLGTQYGGDGRSTFALPDLRGRTPMNMGPVNAIGIAGGTETVTLVTGNLPAHNHAFVASTAPANLPNVGGSSDRLLAASYVQNSSNPSGNGPGKNIYGPAGSATAMAAGVCAATGGGQAHDNMQPSVALNYMIALTGIYPSRD